MFSDLDVISFSLFGYAARFVFRRSVSLNLLGLIYSKLSILTFPYPPSDYRYELRNRNHLTQPKSHILLSANFPHAISFHTGRRRQAR